MKLTLPCSPSDTTSSPASACLRTTSATAARTCPPKAPRSYGRPCSFSRMVSNSSLGRARLPTWVVRIRSVLLFTRPCYLRSVSVLGILPHGRIGVCWRSDEGPGHGAGRPRGDRGDGSPSRGRRRGGQGPLLRHLRLGRPLGRDRTGRPRPHPGPRVL